MTIVTPLAQSLVQKTGCKTKGTVVVTMESITFLQTV